MHVPRHAQHDLLGHVLDRCGDIHVPPVDGFIGPPRRAAEQGLEFLRRHGQALAVIEIRQVKPQRAIGLQVHQLAQYRRRVARLAIRREPHQLVFAVVDRESAVVGKRRVQQPDRVWKPQLALDLDAVAAPDAETGGRPFPGAIERQDCRFLERRGEKGACSVRLMMPGENELLPVGAAEGAAHFAWQVQLLPQPRRHCADEAAETGRSVGDVGFEQPVEMHERLFVEPDIVKLRGIKPGLLQAGGDGPCRERSVVLDAGESFFLGSSHDFAIDDQRGGGIVVIGRNAENRGHDARNLT